MNALPTHSKSVSINKKVACVLKPLNSFCHHLKHANTTTDISEPPCNRKDQNFPKKRGKNVVHGYVRDFTSIMCSLILERDCLLFLSGLTLGILWLCRGLGLEYHAHVPQVNTSCVYRHLLARAGEVPLYSRGS